MVCGLTWLRQQAHFVSLSLPSHQTFHSAGAGGWGGGGVKAAVATVLFGSGTQYLVDLQDFSPLLGGRAALGGRAILELGAVVLHEGNQQLKAKHV